MSDVPKDRTNHDSLRESLRSTETVINDAIRYHVLSEIYDKTQEQMGDLAKDMDDDTQNDMLKTSIDALTNGMFRKPENS